jgi:hypothetical protein
MIEILEAVTLGVLLAVMCFLAGGWVVFKTRSAVPGESLFGGVPKGQVFSVKDDTDRQEEPDPETIIAERTNEFLKQLGG